MASASSETRSVIRTTAASFLLFKFSTLNNKYEITRSWYMTSVDVLRQQSLNSAVTTSCTRCYQTPFPSPYSNRGLACETTQLTGEWMAVDTRSRIII